MAVLVRDLDPCIDRAWASAVTVRPVCFTKAFGCHYEGADDEYQRRIFTPRGSRCDGGRALTCLGRMQATHLVSGTCNLQRHCEVVLPPCGVGMQTVSCSKTKEGEEEKINAHKTTPCLGSSFIDMNTPEELHVSFSVKPTLSITVSSSTVSSITRACSDETFPSCLVEETVVFGTVLMSTTPPATFAMYDFGAYVRQRGSAESIT